MIEVPVHNYEGKQVEIFEIDEQLLGSRVRPALLKQSYVRYHANRHQGSAATKNRSQVEGSTRKIYRQKGTGNARHGTIRANLMRGGGRAFAKKPHAMRQKMPIKMRRLANRNALLAKAIDGEIKLLDKIDFKKPSTKDFVAILKNLQIDRSCLIALSNTTGNEARSASNIANVSLTQIDRLNTFDLLNHRYLLSDKASLQSWLEQAKQKAGVKVQEESD
jgi:large subunit ribosomal protein L4